MKGKKPKIIKCNMEKPEIRIMVAEYSYAKFIRDAMKYGDWCVLPHCDLCGEVYPHYYVKNSLWKKTGLDNWVCLNCLEKKLGRKLTRDDMMGLHENLFEVKESLDNVDQTIRDIKTGEITFHNILLSIYDIDIYGKNKDDYLKYERKQRGIIKII